MAHLLYRVDTPAPTLPPGTGLESLLAAPVCTQVADPLTGAPCLLVSEGFLPPGHSTIDHARQTWGPRITAPNGVKTWVGYWNEYRPTPGELARPAQLAALEIPLEDGQAWRLPRLMMPTGEPSVPLALGIGEDGKLTRTPMQRYRSLCDRARVVWRMVFDAEAAAAEGVALSEEEQFRLIADALAENYRLDAAGVSLLAMVSDRVLAQCLTALLGLDILEAMRRARESEGKQDAPTQPLPSIGSGVRG